MDWRYLTFLVAAFCCTSPVRAADKPELAPPAAWIKPLTAPTLAQATDAAAVHLLLNDVQVSFDGDTTRSFISTAIQVAKPEGLTALGTFMLAWKPDTDRVVVHWLRIRRGDKVIDVLGQQQFTILRREQNLEMAAIDGVLTATMPIAGLQVGDIVESAWTIERTEPLLKGHHDITFDAGTAGNIARLGLAVRWNSSDRVVVHSQNLPATLATKSNMISLVAGPVEPLILPQGAPQRFRMGRLIELSDFASWEEVSATFAPLYAAARQIRADSPLHAEIERIKAASADPAERAGLALKLVEDNVRYLFVGLNDSNLRPASADDTWQRRFGDCKAKTALLLALLDGLGIEGDAVLVSTVLGDGMDARLPNASLFNHVIVRATIAGKTYWLDGTRLGDRHVADLDVPDFHWALPLKPQGGALERLVVAPKTSPNTIFDLHLDATRGILAPALAHAEVTFLGDVAVATHTNLAGVSKGALDQRLRSYWSDRYDFITPDKVSEVWDEAARTERLVMDGSARMAWDGAGNNGRRYELDGAQIGWHGDYRRQPGPNSDAPFAFNYPDFVEYRETVLLPNDGDGFSLIGNNVDKELARHALYRHTEVAGNRVTMVARERPLAPELPFTEAQAANDELRTLSDSAVDILLDTKRYFVTADDARAMLGVPVDKTENGYRMHVSAYIALNDAKAGLAEAQRYTAAFPQSAEALASRATLEAAADMEQQAKADATQVLAMAPDNAEAKLIMAFYQDRADRANESGTRSVFLAWVKWGQAEACRHEHDYVCARRFAEAALALQPNVGMIYVTLANTYQAQGRIADADAVADRMVAAAPKDADMLAVAGVIYCSTGQRTKGLAAFAASIAAKPTITAYLNRIRYLPHDDLAARKRDIDSALKLDPKDVDSLQALADWQGEAGDHSGQLATLQTIAAQGPADPEPNMQKAITMGGAYARAGQADKARESFAEVRGYAMASKDGQYFNGLCYTAAEANFDLTTALGDCNRAVALEPKSAPVLDSLGFVQLRLGHFAEAITAYDKVLAIDPHEPHSLYGRGIAYLRQGDKTKGEADLAAAGRQNAAIAEQFHAMGVNP